MSSEPHVATAAAVSSVTGSHKGECMTEQADHGSLVASMTEQLPHLRRYAMVLCRHRDQADDLVQEALLRAIDHLHQFRPGTNLRAWLFTILRNAHLNNCRRNQRYGVTSIDERPAAFEQPAPSAQADVVALKELERCMLEIPDEQREALLLVVVEGMTYEEAAEVMEVPIGTIRSRVSRARRALLHLFAAQEEASELQVAV